MQVGHIILLDLSWNICLKWHMSWRNRTSANRFTADKACKHCITLEVHFRSASQLYTGNTWRGNIHYAEEEVFFSSRPPTLTALTALPSSLLFCWLKGTFFSYSIPSVVDVIYFSGLGIREEMATRPGIFHSMPQLKQRVKYAVIIKQT